MVTWPPQIWFQHISPAGSTNLMVSNRFQIGDFALLERSSFLWLRWHGWTKYPKSSYSLRAKSLVKIVTSSYSTWMTMIIQYSMHACMFIALCWHARTLVIYYHFPTYMPTAKSRLKQNTPFGMLSTFD